MTSALSEGSKLWTKENKREGNTFLFFRVFAQTTIRIVHFPDRATIQTNVTTHEQTNLDNDLPFEYEMVDDVAQAGSITKTVEEAEAKPDTVWKEESENEPVEIDEATTPNNIDKKSTTTPNPESKFKAKAYSRYVSTPESKFKPKSYPVGPQDPPSATSPGDEYLEDTMNIFSSSNLRPVSY